MSNKQSRTLQTNLQPKPPVVVVMGHVDHGKTTLLDTIRKSRITQKEQGGITQHIGAYQVPVGDKKITFIDTPGHEAFTNLRSRGAQVADIALLVIDASESVKPQTRESIKLIKNSNLPMIVALNKIDLPNANPEKVKKDLLQENVQVEEMGGKIATVAISAKTGKGLPDLLDAILLVAEFKHISAQFSGPFSGTVIESCKDTGKGCHATVIVQQGVLRSGETVFIDGKPLKARALFNEFGKPVPLGEPGMPVEVLGFSSVAQVGSILSSEQHPSIIQDTSEADKEKKQSEDSVLSVFIKADMQGSLEAIINGLPPEVTIVHADIGDVTEGDVVKAKTEKSIILSYNVAVPQRVKQFAIDEQVRLREYSIIYKLFEEVEEVVEILKKGPQKDIIGQAEVVKIFDTSEGLVAGCRVTENRIARGDMVSILRSKKEIADKLKIVSIRQEKEQVNKVEKGKMCGVLFSRKVDLEIGDMIQSYIQL